MKYLSVVAVMKDELRNLPEWLDFHRRVGVEHFYLYDNNSTDGTWGYFKDEEFEDVSYFKTDMRMLRILTILWICAKCLVTSTPSPRSETNLDGWRL